jgi:hypothetical protein
VIARTVDRLARWRLGVAVALLLAGGIVCAERVDNRVGGTYWARPALSETSVEFFGDLALRDRQPVRGKVRFRIVEVQIGGPWPPSDPIYRVEFDDARRAFIDVREFERRLYRELRPNEVAVAPNFEPPLGRGVQVHQFERASIFAADPDVMWARVRDQGPRTFQTLRSGVPVPVVPPVITPADPVAPIIAPR